MALPGSQQSQAEQFMSMVRDAQRKADQKKQEQYKTIIVSTTSPSFKSLPNPFLPSGFQSSSPSVKSGSTGKSSSGIASGGITGASSGAKSGGTTGGSKSGSTSSSSNRGGVSLMATTSGGGPPSTSPPPVPGGGVGGSYTPLPGQGGTGPIQFPSTYPGTGSGIPGSNVGSVISGGQPITSTGPGVSVSPEVTRTIESTGAIPATGYGGTTRPGYTGTSVGRSYTPPPISQEHIQQEASIEAQKKADENALKLSNELQNTYMKDYAEKQYNKEFIESAMKFGVGVEVGPYGRTVYYTPESEKNVEAFQSYWGKGGQGFETFQQEVQTEGKRKFSEEWETRGYDKELSKRYEQVWKEHGWLARPNKEGSYDIYNPEQAYYFSPEYLKIREGIEYRMSGKAGIGGHLVEFLGFWTSGFSPENPLWSRSIATKMQGGSLTDIADIQARSREYYRSELPLYSVLRPDAPLGLFMVSALTAGALTAPLGVMGKALPVASRFIIGPAIGGAIIGQQTAEFQKGLAQVGVMVPLWVPLMGGRFADVKQTGRPSDIGPLFANLGIGIAGSVYGAKVGMKAGASFAEERLGWTSFDKSGKRMSFFDSEVIHNTEVYGPKYLIESERIMGFQERQRTIDLFGSQRRIPGRVSFHYDATAKTIKPFPEFGDVQVEPDVSDTFFKGMRETMEPSSVGMRQTEVTLFKVTGSPRFGFTEVFEIDPKLFETKYAVQSEGKQSLRFDPGDVKPGPLVTRSTERYPVYAVDKEGLKIGEVGTITAEGATTISTTLNEIMGRTPGRILGKVSTDIVPSGTGVPFIDVSKKGFTFFDEKITTYGGEPGQGYIAGSSERVTMFSDVVKTVEKPVYRELDVIGYTGSGAFMHHMLTRPYIWLGMKSGKGFTDLARIAIRTVTPTRRGELKLDLFHETAHWYYDEPVYDPSHPRMRGLEVRPSTEEALVTFGSYSEYLRFRPLTKSHVFGKMLHLAESYPSLTNAVERGSTGLSSSMELSKQLNVLMGRRYLHRVKTVGGKKIRVYEDEPVSLYPGEPMGTGSDLVNIIKDYGKTNLRGLKVKVEDYLGWKSPGVKQVLAGVNVWGETSFKVIAESGYKVSVGDTWRRSSSFREWSGTKGKARTLESQRIIEPTDIVKIEQEMLSLREPPERIVEADVRDIYEALMVRSRVKKQYSDFLKNTYSTAGIGRTGTHVTVQSPSHYIGEGISRQVHKLPVIHGELWKGSAWAYLERPDFLNQPSKQPSYLRGLQFETLLDQGQRTSQESMLSRVQLPDWMLGKVSLTKQMTGQVFEPGVITNVITDQWTGQEHIQEQIQEQITDTVYTTVPVTIPTYPTKPHIPWIPFFEGEKQRVYSRKKKRRKQEGGVRWRKHDIRMFNPFG